MFTGFRTLSARFCGICVHITVKRTNVLQHTGIFVPVVHGTQRLHHFHHVSARRPGPVPGANGRVFVHLLGGVIVSDVRGAGSFWVKRCLRDFTLCVALLSVVWSL